MGSSAVPGGRCRVSRSWSAASFSASSASRRSFSLWRTPSSESCSSKAASTPAFTRASFSSWTRRATARDAFRVARLSLALTSVRNRFLASAAVSSAFWFQSARESSIASSAVVMPRSVTCFPKPFRSGWERERVSSGCAKRDVESPRLSFDQKLVNDADAVAPVERSWSSEAFASKKRDRSTTADVGPACRFSPRWSRRAESVGS